MYNYEDLFSFLPERMRKRNTHDLYYVLFDDRAELNRAIGEVMESRNIDAAYGKTLDLIGGNVGQIRQGEGDELYRNLIKVRIIANLSMGNIPTINRVLSVLVKEVYQGLEEAWKDACHEFEPSKIVIKLGMGASDFPFDLVERIKSAGVRVLYEIHYKATSDLLWAGGRRRILKLGYRSYEPEDIKGDEELLFAGRFVSVTRVSRPYYFENIRPKGAGKLRCVLGRLRGELIE